MPSPETATGGLQGVRCNIEVGLQLVAKEDLDLIADCSGMAEADISEGAMVIYL
jgi:hypothetical protein